MKSAICISPSLIDSCMVGSSICLAHLANTISDAKSFGLEKTLSVVTSIYSTDSNDLHLPQVSRTIYQKRVHYSGIKIFNGLSRAIKDISSEPKKFKVALKHYLLTLSFYSLDEFFLANRLFNSYYNY